MQRRVGKAQIGVTQQNLLAQMRQCVCQRYRDEGLARAALAGADGGKPGKTIVGLQRTHNVLPRSGLFDCKSSRASESGVSVSSPPATKGERVTCAKGNPRVAADSKAPMRRARSAQVMISRWAPAVFSAETVSEISSASDMAETTAMVSTPSILVSAENAVRALPSRGSKPAVSMMVVFFAARSA